MNNRKIIFGIILMAVLIDTIQCGVVLDTITNLPYDKIRPSMEQVLKYVVKAGSIGSSAASTFYDGLGTFREAGNAVSSAKSKSSSEAAAVAT